MYKFVLGLIAMAAASACGGAPSPSEERTETIIRGVNFVGVSVTDLDRATAFYSDAANLERVQESVLADSTALDAIAGRTGVRARTRLVRSVNAQLRLMQFEDPSAEGMSTPAVPVQGPGVAHVCYQVEKNTRTYERFLEAGAEPIGEREMVQLNEQNPVYYAYARDHDGIIFEVEHIDFDKLDLERLGLDEPPQNEYRIRHVSLATPDIQQTVEFYSTLLEEPNPRRVGRLGGISGEKIDQVSGLPGSKIKMAWFQIRNLELEIFEYVSHPTEIPATPRPLDAPGYNMIVFDASDLVAARERLLAAGGTVASAIEPMDGGDIFFGRDPDGNLLGFQHVAPDAAVSSRNFKNDGA